MGHIAESKQRTLSPGSSWLSRGALALVLLLAASSARAQTPHLVKDINGAFPYVENLTAVGATVFFTASGMGLGTELWKTDGTAAGTVLVKDIEVGPHSSFPTGLTAAGSTLYFQVNGSSGWTLWRSDGTPIGTVPLKDQAHHGDLADVDGVLFFVRGEIGTGLELWRTDGTTVGTSFVSPIANGPTGFAPLNLTASEGSLYYTTSSPYALWRSDGTTAGTYKVSDLPGEASWLTNVDGILFFRGENGELWRSDGTPAGTDVLWDGGVIDPNRAMVNINGTLYLSADDGVHGYEPWRSDGTPAGTFMVMDVLPGSGSTSPGEFVQAGGIIFFGVSNSLTGYGLWKMDEPSGGASQVAAGPAGGLTEFQGSIWFWKNDGVSGPELWRSDGMAVGTFLVRDIQPGGYGSTPSQLIRAGEALIFAAGVFPHRDLWRSDGSAAGTSLVTTFIGPGGSEPTYVATIGERAYFSADDRIHGRELWTSDGTAAGTFLVKDLSPGPSGTNPRSFAISGGTTFFSGGPSLWRTDATAVGTTVVKDVGAVYLTDLDGTLLFRGYTEAPNESGLWRSDGTEAGTVLVKSFASGPDSSGWKLPTLNGVAFYRADDGVNGEELWRSDGTVAGAWIVRDIHPGPTGSGPLHFRTGGGLLFFVADDGMHGPELWRSDGTHAGTFLVKDIEPGPGGSGANKSLVEYSGSLYFSAFDSLHGWELWKTDGTEAGTMLVVDLEPGPSSSNPYNLTVVQGVLFFSHGTGSYLTDLSSTDGTAAGTTLLRAGIYASRLTPLGNKLYFTGCDPVWGCELWKSDGTPDGTVMVEDIRVGSESSSPDEFAATGDRLFFVADNGAVGRELWTLGTSAPAVESLAVVPGTTTAQLSATVVSDGGAPIIERGFLVSPTNPTPEDGGSDVTKVTVAGTTGPLAATLGGLSPYTPYYLRAFARSSQGVGYDQISFVTGPLIPPPSVTTNAATSITQTGANLNGIVNPKTDATNARFEYGLTTSYGFSSANQAIGLGAFGVAVSYVASGLSCNTLYHFRAVGENSAGTTNGADLTFTTAACPSAGENNIGALTARSIGVNSASSDSVSDVRAETWYRVRLFASRSYQFSAWPVDHELGADAPALEFSLFSDDAGTVPATPAHVISSAAFEGSPNANGDSSPSSAFFEPVTTGVYKLRILGSGATAAHSINVAIRETTLFSPWTSRAADFEGFIEMHNNTGAELSVSLRAYDSVGVLQGAGVTLSIPPNATVFKTAGDVGVPTGVFAGVTLTHNGTFGAVSANTTTLNGANGLAFDSPFTTRNGSVAAAPVR